MCKSKIKPETSKRMTWYKIFVSMFSVRECEYLSLSTLILAINTRDIKTLRNYASETCPSLLTRNGNDKNDFYFHL